MHCSAKIEGEHEARVHVVSKHRGAVSPDKENPSGYSNQNYYSCSKARAEDVKRNMIDWLFGGSK